MMKTTRGLLAAFLIGAAALGAGAQAKPSIIHLDYATYNPVSLVLKAKGWVEQDLAKDGIKVDWTLSQGSNRALEFLNGNTLGGLIRDSGIFDFSRFPSLAEPSPHNAFLPLQGMAAFLEQHPAVA
jgi:hypothetical protein